MMSKITNLKARLLLNLVFIALAMYYSPVLGTILIIIRFFLFDEYIHYKTIAISILALVPNLIETFKLDKTISILNNLVDWTEKIDFYNKIVSSAKTTLIISLILVLVFYLIEKLIDKIYSYARILFSKAIKSSEQKDKKILEIHRQNDLKIKQQTQEAMNKKIIKCKSCGATNETSGNIVRCQYCRKYLIAKE